MSPELFVKDGVHSPPAGPLVARMCFIRTRVGPRALRGGCFAGFHKEDFEHGAGLRRRPIFGHGKRTPSPLQQYLGSPTQYKNFWPSAPLQRPTWDDAGGRGYFPGCGPEARRPLPPQPLVLTRWPRDSRARVSSHERRDAGEAPARVDGVLDQIRRPAEGVADVPRPPPHQDRGHRGPDGDVFGRRRRDGRLAAHGEREPGTRGGLLPGIEVEGRFTRVPRRRPGQAYCRKRPRGAARGLRRSEPALRGRVPGRDSRRSSTAPSKSTWSWPTRPSSMMTMRVIDGTSWPTSRRAARCRTSRTSSSTRRS